MSFKILGSAPTLTSDTFIIIILLVTTNRWNLTGWLWTGLSLNTLKKVSSNLTQVVTKSQQQFQWYMVYFHLNQVTIWIPWKEWKWSRKNMAKKWSKYEILPPVQMKYPSIEYICIIHSYFVCFWLFQEPLCWKLKSCVTINNSWSW